MVEAITRPTQIEISKQALKHNTEVVKKTSGADKIFLAVKSNAYGLGLIPTSKAAVAGGVYGLAVAIIDEALALRHERVTAPILILGISPAKYAELMAVQHILTTVVSLSWLKEAAQYLSGEQRLHVSLGVDTGMGRIGFRDRESLAEAIAYLQENKQLFDYVGLATHFAESDSSNNDYFYMQLKRWHDMTDGLPEPEFYHVANSGAAMYHADEVPHEVVRVGTVLYGVEPSRGELADGKNLQPVMALRSEMNFVKLLPAGEGISYSHKYTTTGDEWIGTVPIGYGDGWLRKMTGFKVIVDGHYAPIVGQVAMDQLMIRLPRQYPVGTKVTFIGKDGGLENTIEDVAQHAGLAPWEIMTGMQDRLHRVLVD
ncbi:MULTISPECIES: alanine racemase [Leuconostoc]|uniref:Alanine racemase n=2 Tax=Leuconostoc kimchii TaxID=136609 RepID=D5T286_LEUKI|nr:MULTISPECIES: alanine racemase [Leuconostoc]ADG40385.1 alanine racemase [Leuconostoc kimchii IMSNU 11154]AEJ31690.1 alanine racemase [Leuconostoc sp. C2]QBR46867.1 alanine racemase [Leuconostoc kimchii]